MFLKNYLINLVHKSAIANAYYAGVATIFMLHRIDKIDPDGIFANENMKVSPAFLETFIQLLRDDGYDIISLDSLIGGLQHRENVRKKAVFTIDDGYADNFIYGYPIFKQLDAPFTVYVTSSFPERRCVLWWYILEDVILQNESVNFPYGNFLCKEKKEKEMVFLHARDYIIRSGTANSYDRLAFFFKDHEVDLYKACIDNAMNWEQIRELSNDKLVTIGGHTISHPVLNRLNETELCKEISEANEIISGHTGKSVRHFAYPFGSRVEVGNREFAVVKKLGIRSATTTRNGNIFREHADHLEALPRIMLTENMAISDIGRPKRKRVIFS